MRKNNQKDKWSQNIVLTRRITAEPGHSQRRGDIAAEKKNAKGHIASSILLNSDNHDQAN